MIVELIIRLFLTSQLIGSEEEELIRKSIISKNSNFEVRRGNSAKEEESLIIIESRETVRSKTDHETLWENFDQITCTRIFKRNSFLEVLILKATFEIFRLV